MPKFTPESEIFTRGVENVVTKEELKKLLAGRRPLRIKHGIDVTGAYHIGQAANLWKIRRLQEAGHQAVILLGDFTTRIGDPTGKSKTRPLLSRSAMEQNAKGIEKWVRRILHTDPGVFELRRNSEWYGKMKTEEFLNLLSLVTHARLIERDMFQKRMKAGSEIYMHELIYPILQGYDSVMLKDDLTIIGSDQLFNEHLGRFFQERFGQRPQVLVSLKILPGLDGGEKMSKSLGNAINLDDSARDKFGKAMRLLDPLIIPYLEVYTDVPMSRVRRIEEGLAGGRNPMEAKLFLAQAMVRRYHGADVAQKERGRFLKVFSLKSLPADLPAIRIEYGLRNFVEVLIEAGLVHSKAEARRLLNQGAVRVNGVKVASFRKRVEIKKDTLIQVGKRRLGRVL